MKLRNSVKRLAVALVVFGMTTGMVPAQESGQSGGVSGGPISGSDQQAQATDLIGKHGQNKVDQFTGSFGYSIPINCPPARHGSEPGLALTYSSAQGNGWCGMGWDLEIGSIERYTRDGSPVGYSSAAPPTPLTQYDDTKGFMLNLPGKGARLFAVATNAPLVEYRAEVDTEFLRCFLDTNNNNWTVYDKSGNVYYFGESTNSRVSNPKTGWSSGYSGTFHWALDQIITVSGDWSTVAYATYTSPYTGLAERTLYPTQITYNGHTNFNGYSASFTGSNTITFQTGVRTNDWGFSFRSGFRTDQTRLLTNILCQVGSQNVWNYSLAYGISPATARSLLTNVVAYGFDAGNSATAYLTNSFGYQANPNGVSFGPPITWTNVDLTDPGFSGIYYPDLTQISGGGANSVADLADMDGDGLPDRICYNSSTQPNQYRIQKNLGIQANGNGLFGPTNAFGPSSTATSGMTSTQAQTASAANPIPDAVDNTPAWAAMNTGYGRVRDLDGDGLPDRVMDYWSAINSIVITNRLPYMPFTNYAVMLNTGQGFYGATNWPVSTGPVVPSASTNSAYYYCIESGGVNVGLFDINGDGRPDRVMSAWYQNGPMTNFMVQFNTGTNFTQPMAFGPYHSQNYNATSQTGQYGWAGIETPDAHMIDINGDGLPDRLMYPMNTTNGYQGQEFPHPAPYYAVEYNDGYSFESTNTSTSVPGAFDKWLGVVAQTGDSQIVLSPSGPTFYSDAILDPPFTGLYDMNGDGLPDRVVLNLASISNNGSYSTWNVYLNNGHGFNTNPILLTNILNEGYPRPNTGFQYWGMEGSDNAGNTVTTLIDMNGDGLLDRVLAISSGQLDVSTVSNFFLVQLNLGPPPDLLTNVNNGIGGIVSVAYKSSTAYDNRVYPTNAASVSRMPFPRQVAATVTESDSINPPQTTTYSYAGGYYDGPRREFHGFAVVTNTDPTLRSTVTYFHTGGGRNYAALGEYQDAGDFAKVGMAYRVETYGNDGELYHVMVNQVNQTSLGNARYFPFTALNFDCDYPGNGTPLATATQFSYDQTTGNLTNKIEYGQVTINPANVGSFSFTNTDGTDDRHYNTTYASISGNSYIVDHPVTAILADNNGSTVKETDYAYNSSSGTIATKSTRIATGYYATDSYGNYTSFGMVGQTTDPVGVQTSIAYDSTYNTYPATTTTGTFTNTTSYDPRSGQLASSTDSAGLTITNNFDLFCRPTETDKIPIGGGTPVWVNKYAYPAVLKPISSGMAVNYADEVENDGVGGFTNRTYIDGFGRPVQTRTQGENGNFRVVSTAYDGRGNAFLTTWPIFGTGLGFAVPSGSLTAAWIGYDAPGRVATNRPVTASFNSNGAVTGTTVLNGDIGSPLAASTWSYVNGANPWWIVFTDEDGQTRRYGLDAFGRTNQILEVDGTNVYTNLLRYNLADNLTNLVNANGENIFWAYNDDSGLVAMADPYLGQWTYARDYAGRLRVQSDARGDVVSNSYVNPTTSSQDALGRLQVQTVFSPVYSNHTLVPVYTNMFFYDSGTNGYTVYPSLLSRVTDSQGYEQFGYDARARTIKTTRYLTVNTNSYTTSNGYDDGDNVTAIGYPNSGPTINYSYFHGKSINLVSLAGGSGSPYYTINASGYDEFGHATNFAYGNGVTTTRGYYSQSKRLQTVTAGSVFNRTYGYTAGDDITNLSGTGITGTMNVSYYNLHRIKSYSGTGGLSGNYGYDPTGNITNNIEGGGSAYTYNHPRIQAVRTAFNYTNLYDLCGNMVVRHGGQTNVEALTYDPENRLSAIAQAGVFGDQFGYAYDGARLWKHLNQNPTNYQVWIGDIYEEKGGKKLFHVFAGSEQVCTFETNSMLDGGSVSTNVGYYYHQDNLNTSSALSGSSGTQLEVDVYYPFGRPQNTNVQASFQISHRFTGQVFDAESGLYYYNARYYDLELGRFIQPDTTIPELSDPQSYNRYAYCQNNPLTYNDPSGHQIPSPANVALGWTAPPGQEGTWNSQFQAANVKATAIEVSTLAGAAASATIVAAAPVSLASTTLGGYAVAATSGAAGGYVGNGVANVIEGQSFNQNAGTATVIGLGLGVGGQGISDVLGGANAPLTKLERLNMVYDQVTGLPSAKTAQEAMQQMHSTLDKVEDAHSGVAKNPNPGLAPDGRMYPVQPDRMVTGPNGSITATSRSHVTTYGKNGSITVSDKATGNAVYHKPGGG